MKLFDLFKDILITEVNKKPIKGVTIFSKIVDNKLIELKSTYHQRTEREGSKTYDEIVDKYNEFLETRRSKFARPPRIAVPDSMIRKFFSDNVEKIYKSFEDEKPKNNTLIFVHKRKDNEDNDQFDYIEVLLDKDGNFFNIITSAFSPDGKFLKTRDEEKRAEKVRLEQINRTNLKIIYI